MPAFTKKPHRVIPQNSSFVADNGKRLHRTGLSLMGRAIIDRGTVDWLTREEKSDD